MTGVTLSIAGVVAVVRFGEPRVNALGHGTRKALLGALDAAAEDATVGAIVLAGNGELFSAGADIRELGAAAMLADPTLRDLVDAVESCPKPVVAAIDGACLGGGLQLALACHFRVASTRAALGLPEVRLGLLPGAGGTQRLVRAIRLEDAISLIVSGEPWPATRFQATSLLDALVDGDPLPAAISFAADRAATGARQRLRDRHVEDAAGEALVGFARVSLGAARARNPALTRCLDAVRAAVTGPFDEGMAIEHRYFMELLATPESRALRHLFLAERAAATIPDVPESTRPRRIDRAAIIGAGTMGTGIAISLLNAGIPTTLLDAGQEALDAGVGRIRGHYDGQIRKGRLAVEEAEARLRLLEGTLSYDSIADSDIVIEAVFEDMDAKRAVFETLDRVMKQGAILATNTSTLDVDRLAGCTSRPADVIGTHFFSPANVMRLLEIVRGRVTGKDVLATAMKLARRLGKTAVVAGVCDGFIGNRMIEQYFRQALFMVEEGADIAEIDGAAERFGFAMGPFRVSDLAGNDIGWNIRKRRRVEQPAMVYPAIADSLCELGRFGQKTGGGWYDYRPGDREGRPSPAVSELIATHRSCLGLRSRKPDDREIVDRLVYSLVLEGARLLGEGIAQRASDIDVVYVTGYGFPAWRGGPMCYAHAVGLRTVARRIREFGRSPHGDPAFWDPAPLLDMLDVREGASSLVRARS